MGRPLEQLSNILLQTGNNHDLEKKALLEKSLDEYKKSYGMNNKFVVMATFYLAQFHQQLAAKQPNKETRKKELYKAESYCKEGIDGSTDDSLTITLQSLLSEIRNDRAK